MILRLDEIPPEGKELSFELDIDQFNERLRGDSELAGTASTGVASSGMAPVVRTSPRAEVRAELAGITVFLSGRGYFKAEMLCSRCGEPFDVNFDADLSMVLKPKGRSNDEVEDVNLGFYEGREIDLDPIVEEQLILALPYQILCQESCKGLCLGCGENLNIPGSCNCVKTPREDALKETGPKEGKFLPFQGLKSKLKV